MPTFTYPVPTTKAQVARYTILYAQLSDELDRVAFASPSPAPAAIITAKMRAISQALSTWGDENLALANGSTFSNWTRR